MKILVLSHEFPPIGGGGGRAAYDICRELVKRGHMAAMLTAHMKDLPRGEIIDGIQVMRIPSLRTQPYRASFSAMLAFVLAGLWAGYRFIKKNRPDIIHAHFAVPAGALAYALSFLTRIPYALTVHLGDVPGGVPEKTGKWFRWIQPFTSPIWKHARRVIAVSEFTRQLALKYYAVDISVIPNGVDLENLSASKIQVGQPPRIVFAGRFVPQKNPLAIVWALAELKELNWRCSMLGDGPLLDEVKREIGRLGLADRFELPGWVTPEEVLERFSQSDILFMPSLSEGLPIVGVQALAKGLAFVVSNIGGFVDLVNQERNGFLVEGGDHSGFVQPLRKLISEPAMLAQFREASLAKAGRFDIRRVAEEYDKVLREARGSSGG